MTRYTAATDADRAAMLSVIGVDSIDDLFADVPEGLRLRRPLGLPAGMAEQDVFAHLSELAARNVSARSSEHSKSEPRHGSQSHCSRAHNTGSEPRGSKS